MRAQGEWRGAGRRFLHRPHASQHPSVAERPSAQVLNVDDDLGCSNARRSLSMLVILSSIVSMPELAAAQSFVAFTIIAGRARRTRAAQCLLAQQPQPAEIIYWLVVEKSASISPSGSLGYLLRDSFFPNELALCMLWWADFMRAWSLPRPPSSIPCNDGRFLDDRWQRGVQTLRDRHTGDDSPIFFCFTTSQLR